jgi:hypothetical protein
VPAFGPEERRAYTRQLGAGRTRTRRKEYAGAVAAFSKALDAIPDDARALGERAYAKHLMGDEQGAMADLSDALIYVPDADKKLLAQIEFNLGLVSDALADLDHDDTIHGRAAGHYRRSFEANPTAAAKLRMVGCPLEHREPKVEIFKSLNAAMGRKSTDVTSNGDAVDPDQEWQPRDELNRAFTRPDDQLGTAVALVLEDSRIAVIHVGNTTPSRCDMGGLLTAELESGVWVVTYQAVRASVTGSNCWCRGRGDGNDEEIEQSECEKLDGCECVDPYCQSFCVEGNEEEGAHTVDWIDRKTGQGLWHVDVDHSFLDDIQFKVDALSGRFQASGAGCAVDVHVQRRAD